MEKSELDKKIDKAFINLNALSCIDESPPKIINTPQLTSHQREICNNIKSAIVCNNLRRVVLRGSAGVGKTFMVDTMIRELYEEYFKTGKVLITAPTNKAVAVLLNKAEDNIKWWMEYTTIHRALQLKRVINGKTGEVSFEQKIDDRNPPFRNCKLLIIDEASMLSTELLKFLEGYPHLTIIFLGKMLPK